MNQELDSPKKLSELLKPGMTLMVGTAAEAQPGSASPAPIESRPLTVADIDQDTIRVLVDSTARFTHQARAGEQAHVVVSDNRENVWASLNATMAFSQDEAVIDELWNPFAAAYFDDGRGSTNIGVLLLRVEDGTYWSTPSGRLGSLVSMIKAKLGDAEQSGEHGKVSV